MKETREIIKWFEDLLGVENLTFLYGSDSKVFESDCSGYDFEIKVLTRNVLYFDKTNNIISTHSPYGTHWEKRKDVAKLKSNENFRWVIKGADFLSSIKFCNVWLETYDGDIEDLGCFNSNNVLETYDKLYENLKLIMKK